MPKKNSHFKKNLLFIFLFLTIGIFATAYLAFNTTPIFVKHSGKNAAYSGQAQIGGAFKMVNQHGQIVTEQILQGKKTLMFFGYTHCPDICPTSLITIMQALNALPEDAQQKYQVIFVSIDPQRDTPELLKEYMENFNPAYTALTGTPDALKAMAKKYLVYYAKSKDAQGEYYLMDHSAYIYLFDEKGQYQKHFSHKSTPEEVHTILKKYK